MPPRLPLLLAAWTVLVWGTRISNVLDDDGSAWALAVASLMSAGAVAVLVAAVTRRWMRQAVFGLAGATIAVWAIRAPGIVLDGDHGAGFKLVHSALALVSIVLALTASGAVRARRPVRA